MAIKQNAWLREPMLANAPAQGGDAALSGDVTAFAHDFRFADPQERANLLQEFANGQAKPIYDTSRSSPQWAPQPPSTISGLRKAVLFIMAKDEADIIGQNLRHHYALGFRRFFVLDNASTDQTAAIIRSFRTDHPEADVFYAYDYVVGHYQAAKMKALDAFMQSYLHYEDLQPEWLFFVDADEFIACGITAQDESIRHFNQILNDPSINILVFHWVQCASNAVIQSVGSHEDLFRVFPLNWPSMKVSVPKIAYRLGKGLAPIQGNHMVEAFPYDLDSVAVMAAANHYLFHFPNRSVEQLRRKVVNANKALTATKDRDGLSGTAGHWRAYYQWYEEHGDAALEKILSDHIEGCLI